MGFTALWAHKLRTILTTLGITIGVFTVGTVTAIIEGLNSSFSEQISLLGSDVFYISRSEWFGGYEEWIKSWKRKPITMETADFIMDHAHLVNVASPSFDSRLTLKYKGKSLESVNVEGVNQHMAFIEGTEIISGRYFTESDISHRKNVTVIGETIRAQFFPNIDPIGQVISIKGQKFTVIGLFEKKGEMLGWSIDNRIQIPYMTFTKFIGGRRTDANISVKASHPEVVDDSIEEVTAIMRHNRGLKPQEENDFAINQMDSLMDMYNQMTAMLWAVAIGIGSISLIVGGIGVMNIMLVTVTERTREIGIRKSIGATRQKILLQFLMESMVVCSLGVGIGLALASGITFLIDQFSPLAARVPASWGFLGAGTVIIVGLVFGLLPANKAAKLNPIDALGYS